MGLLEVWETPGSSAFSKSCGKARVAQRGFPWLGTFHSPSLGDIGFRYVGFRTSVSDTSVEFIEIA